MLHLYRSWGLSETGKHKCPAESTQGTLTYQEACEEIEERGRFNGPEVVEAMREKPMLRDQSFPHCHFLAGEDTSQQTDRKT